MLSHLHHRRPRSRAMLRLSLLPRQRSNVFLLGGGFPRGCEMHRGERSSYSAIQRVSAVGAASLLFLALSGCGSKLAQVTGVVTVDGQPLRGGNDVRATVVFQPTTSAGTAA